MSGHFCQQLFGVVDGTGASARGHLSGRLALSSPQPASLGSPTRGAHFSTFARVYSDESNGKSLHHAFFRDSARAPAGDGENEAAGYEVDVTCPGGRTREAERRAGGAERGGAPVTGWQQAYVEALPGATDWVSFAFGFACVYPLGYTLVSEAYFLLVMQTWLVRQVLLVIA